MALQPAAYSAPMGPRLRLKFDPLQAIQHAAGNFLVQPRRVGRCNALPAGNCVGIKGWRVLLGGHVNSNFATAGNIDLVSNNLTSSIKRFGFSILTRQLPSQCAVCKTWPSAQVCGLCVARFSSSALRCKLCAISLLPDLSSGLAGARDVCIECIKLPPPLDETCVAVDYAYPWSALITQYKFADRPDWAPFFARLLLQAPSAALAFHSLADNDLILPVPLSKERLQTRGFNQAWELAIKLAAQSGTRAQLEYALLLRVKNTQPQTALKRLARLENVKGAFQIDPLRAGVLAGKRVVLVDDVMTSGASLFASASVLRAAGAAHITGIVLARTPQ